MPDTSLFVCLHIHLTMAMSQLANAAACMQRLMACIKEYQRLHRTREDVESGFWQVVSTLDVLS